MSDKEKIELLIKLIEDLAEQQAMPDDWWKIELDKIVSNDLYHN